MGMNDTLFLLLCISSSQCFSGSTDQLQVKELQESSQKQLCTLLLFLYVNKALPPTKTRRVGGDSQERPSYAAITNNTLSLSGPNIKHFCFFLFSVTLTYLQLISWELCSVSLSYSHSRTWNDSTTSVCSCRSSWQRESMVKHTPALKASNWKEHMSFSLIL